MPVSPEGMNFRGVTLEGVIDEIDTKLEWFRINQVKACWPYENDWAGYTVEIPCRVRDNDAEELVKIYQQAGWMSVKVEVFERGKSHITLCMHPSSPLLAKQ